MKYIHPWAAPLAEWEFFEDAEQIVILCTNTLRLPAQPILDYIPTMVNVVTELNHSLYQDFLIRDRGIPIIKIS